MDEKTVFKIGQHINALRTKKGLSVEELANLIGKDRSTVYRYENGEIQDISLAVILDAAEALNVSPAELCCWKEQERLRLDIAKEQAATILVRQMEKIEKAFDSFIDEKGEEFRPELSKRFLIPDLSQLAEALSKLDDR